MIREDIQENADLRFIGKTDAQILRELYGSPARRRAVSRDEKTEHQIKAAAAPDDETGSQIH
jgi:hypothetical protein